MSALFNYEQLKKAGKITTLVQKVETMIIQLTENFTIKFDALKNQFFKL